MTTLIAERDLRALNSLTKYPSIPTYHALDPKNGGLLEEPTDFGDGTVIATEKVDGTNSRIILLPDGTYLLGSREELLYAQGDLIGNPALGIVEQLKPVAQRLAIADSYDRIVVAYLELYGGKIGGAAKQYTNDPTLHGWRLFDVAVLDGWSEQMGWPPHRISTWRDGGGQLFLGEQELYDFANDGLIEVMPRLLATHDGGLPTTVEGMHAMLTDILPETRVRLVDGAGGRPEGVVFRTPDRKVIAKARFQDYERTLKRRGGAR